MVLLALTLAPVFAIMVFIYLRDKYEPEPLKHILISFFLGCFSVIPAIILEVGFGEYFPEDSTNLARTAFIAFVVVAGSEEFSKLIMLRYYAFRQIEFDEPFDGIVYGVMVSLGFAAVENLSYVYLNGGGVSVALLRMFTAIPAHASFGVVMGYYFGLAWKHKEFAINYKMRGFLSAVLLHGTYDFFLMQSNYPAFAFFSLLGLIVSIRLSFKAIKAHQEDSPFHPNKLQKDDENLN